MSSFICPVCAGELHSNGKSLFCLKNHNFDISKSGYTNLLLSQSTKAKHHGDDKLMVRSRQAFLNKGYYKPLLDRICEIVKPYAFTGARILDAGCGECWYTANLYEYLVQNQITPEMFGVDISKDALAAGAKRNRNIELAVAGVFNLPVSEDSCDMLLSLFAPFSLNEFRRVLKKGGILVKAFPLEKHLWSLKTAVYDKPYENETAETEAAGFKLIRKSEVRGRIRLDCSEDILNLFAMTPYYYKTSAEDQQKLKAVPAIDTETEFGIFVYRKEQAAVKP